MQDIALIIEELDELMKPYLICVCEEPVEGRLIENRFTYGCANCGGVIPLKWAISMN